MTDDPTLRYYSRHAEDYFVATRKVEMGSLYEPFLRWLPGEGKILDAGCGSGRDARAFLDMGFDVVAIEASGELAALAEGLIGKPVLVLRFEEMPWEDEFDGIWACASLLHVSYNELPAVFDRMYRALKPRGILYASFKYGDAEREKDGRRFTDMNEERLTQLLRISAPFSLLEQWTTSDLRPGREEERWLNLVLRAEDRK